MPNAGFSAPAAVYSATANWLPVTVTPSAAYAVAVPATRMSPPARTATAAGTASSPAKAVSVTPPVPKAASSDPSALNRVTPNDSAGAAPTGPTSTDWLPSAATPVVRVNPTSWLARPPVPNVGSRPPIVLTGVAVGVGVVAPATVRLANVAGVSVPSVATNVYVPGVARYTARGVLDTTFGTTGKVVVDPAAGTATPAVAASALGALFNAFTASEQGAVAVTPGGEILSAGQAGADTVEAELVAAGVDLVARVLSALPASVPAGGKVRATVTVTEAGSDVAAGSITIAMAYAPDAAGTGGTAAKAFAYRVNLKPAKGKSYKLSVAVPAGLSAGSYYVVATVADGTGLTADLDAANNTAVSVAAVTVG